MWSFSLLLVLQCISQARAKAVFAHFMVGNVPTWSATDWENDIALAQTAHIDAFALNIAYGDDTVPASLAKAFTAANAKDFKLFFSFDYAGGTDGWPASDVLDYLNEYIGNGAYYLTDGQPFVSTFEGPDWASDWADIKTATNCFFVPDWSSLGADAAMQKAPGTPDGLFSWAAWPWGNEDMNTYVDASYLQYLDGLPYMMPVSPWFYTNLPGYDKNWLWRGDDLWHDRWQEVMYVQPEFVEIITWNDYGECHYIGPLHDEEYDLFSHGPYNYAKNMPHDGWRQLLPYYIDMYKSNTTTITQEELVAWYRLQPKSACSKNGTSGNTATQLQLEFEPTDIVQDKIFYSALLTASESVTVSIGGVSQTGTWSHTPPKGVGVYHGSVSTNGGTGAVVVTVGGMTMTGEAITTDCVDGEFENFNAWVGSASGSSVSATPLSMDDQVCVAGNGTGSGFSLLCEFSCALGYCPIGACYCTDMGPQAAKPSPVYQDGYPIAGENEDYSGLCSFACNLDYCPDTVCSTVQVPLETPTVSPFSPPACIAGEGDGNLGGLCSYACNFGYCPISSCTCTAEGALVETPAITNPGTYEAASGLDGFIYDGLCQFTCERGYCPSGACGNSTASLATSGDADTVGTIGIVPLPCTTVASGATFTMSAACTSGILALPTSGPDASVNNDPSGSPSTCDEVCDIWRILTGSCCGYGGYMGNPVVIPSSVKGPYDIPLPTGFVPSFNITLPVPGAYDPDVVFGSSSWPVASSTSSGSNPTSTGSQTKATGTNGESSCVQGDCGCYPADTPLETLLAGVAAGVGHVLPGGYCHGHSGGIIIPAPLPLPADPVCTDPDNCRPCQLGVCGDDGESDSDQDDDSCDAYISTGIGLCDNGNFPLYIPEEDTISCDYDADDAAELLSACQYEADEYPDYTIELIECEDESCPVSKKRATTCPPTAPTTRGQLLDGDTTLGCDYTFECNTDWWPNVCHNAASAISVRGKSQVLTYQGTRARPRGVTAQYWNTHDTGAGNMRDNVGGRDARAAANWVAQEGWGLIGCEVEEYPFGNSAVRPAADVDRLKWSNRATLRLIPGDENQNHGITIGSFIRKARTAKYGAGSTNTGAGDLTYCVSITGTIDSDYLLGADQSQNRCGEPFGPAFLLMNDVPANQAAEIEAYQASGDISSADARIWDPWFDSRLFEHTVYSSGAVVATKMLPSQYGQFPSPGMRTYLGRNNDIPASGGFWSLQDINGVVIGVPADREPANAQGTNLKWDAPNADWASSLKVRDLEDITEKFELQAKEVRASEPEPVSVNSTVVGLASDGELLGASFSRRSLSPRQLTSGSFLDIDVYTKALECASPWEDPCTLGEDCFDGGTVWGPDGEPLAGSGASASPGSTAATATATITSAPTPTCNIDEDPDAGITGAFCVCEGYASTLPTLSNTASPCAYTALPSTTAAATTTTSTGEYAYSITAPDGDIVACKTASYAEIDGSTVTECAVSLTTIYTAPASPTYTFGMYYQDSCDNEPVDGHPIADPCDQGTTVEAGIWESDDICTAKTFEMKSVDDGLYESYLARHMVFENGICGSPAPYYCNTTASDDDDDFNDWNCMDANGGNTATCTRLSSPWWYADCEPYEAFEYYLFWLHAECTSEYIDCSSYT